MYTEFNAAFKLKEGTPDNVIGEVKALCELPISGGELECGGWPGMFMCHSYYFDADPHSTCRLDEITKQYHVTIRCNFKNYGSEIESFVDWIWPHVDLNDYDIFIGYKRYEEDDLPTLLLNKGGKVFWHRVPLDTRSWCD